MVAREMIGVLVPLAGSLVGIAAVRAWLARTSDLELSLFRPWRGDPWPHAVEEDDDFRIDWTAAGATASATVVQAATGSHNGALELESAESTALGSIEEVTGGSVASERVERIDVRRIAR